MTVEKGKYLVLSLSFGSVGTLGNIRDNFRDIIIVSLESFLLDYPFLGKVELDEENHHTSFSKVMSAVRRSGHEVYLIIDEFDSFANELLFYIDNSTPDLGLAEYKRGAVKGLQTLNSFGSLVKCESDVIGRMFITGLSPVAVAAGLSSFNMALDVSDCRELEAAVGFTADEVRQGLSLIYPTQPERIEEHMAIIRTEYDGYRFHSKQVESVYISQLVIYYLDELYRRGKSPEQREMMDINVAHPDNIVSTFIIKNHYKRKSVYEKLQLLIGSYNATRPVCALDLFDPYTIDKSMLQLAYYHSFLTYADPAVEAGLLVVPNAVFRDVIYDAWDGNIGGNKKVAETIARYKQARWGRADPLNADAETTALLAMADKKRRTWWRRLLKGQNYDPDVV